MVHTMAPRSNFAKKIYNAYEYNKTGKQVNKSHSCASSVFMHEDFMRMHKRWYYNFMIRYN